MLCFKFFSAHTIELYKLSFCPVVDWRPAHLESMEGANYQMGFD